MFNLKSIKMKKIGIVASFLLVSSCLISCSSNPEPSDELSNSVPKSEESVLPIKDDSMTIEVKKLGPQIPVGEESFKKLVAYVEKNGFAVPQNGVLCDRQYTFIDKVGNRHALITIKRDDKGQPSMSGNVRQISVWAYYKGKKTQDNFFAWAITRERVRSILDKPSPQDLEAITRGYEEFLTKVN